MHIIWKLHKKHLQLTKKILFLLLLPLFLLFDTLLPFTYYAL